MAVQIWRLVVCCRSRDDALTCDCEVLESWHAVCVLHKHSHWLADRDILCAIALQDLSYVSLFLCLPLNGGFVCLNLGYDLPRGDGIAFLLLPGGDVALRASVQSDQVRADAWARVSSARPLTARIAVSLPNPGAAEASAQLRGSSGPTWVMVGDREGIFMRVCGGTAHTHTQSRAM